MSCSKRVCLRAKSTIEHHQLAAAAEYLARSLQHAPSSEATDEILKPSSVFDASARNLVAAEAHAFTTCPDSADGLCSLLPMVQDAHIRFEPFDVFAQITLQSDIARLVFECCDTAWQETILPLYADNAKYQSQDQFDLLLVQADACCELLELVSELQISHETKKDIFEQLISIHTYCSSASAWAIVPTTTGTTQQKHRYCHRVLSLNALNSSMDIFRN